jgi:hypothetical protein
MSFFLPTHRLIEQVVSYTPLGIRFWDPVSNSQVTGGLRVTARPVDGSGPARSAFHTASGIFAFRNLPGLRRVEQTDPTAPREESLPDVGKDFWVEVIDTEGRFLPVQFRVPAPYHGLYLARPHHELLESLPGSEPSIPSQPPPALPGFYLFSAPTRKPVAGSGCIRAYLVESGTGNEAAYAVVEARVGGHKWYSFADKRGGIALMFPPPPIQTAPVVGSEPARFECPPHENRWPVSLRIRYEPGALRFPAGSDLPDLRSLFLQREVGIYSDEETLEDDWNIELFFAKEFIAKTGSLPSLLIEPGGSVP